MFKSSDITQVTLAGTWVNLTEETTGATVPVEVETPDGFTCGQADRAITPKWVSENLGMGGDCGEAFNSGEGIITLSEDELAAVTIGGFVDVSSGLAQGNSISSAVKLAGKTGNSSFYLLGVDTITSETLVYHSGVPSNVAFTGSWVRPTSVFNTLIDDPAPALSEDLVVGYESGDQLGLATKLDIKLPANNFSQEVYSGTFPSTSIEATHTLSKSGTNVVSETKLGEASVQLSTDNTTYSSIKLDLDGSSFELHKTTNGDTELRVTGVTKMEFDAPTTISNVTGSASNDVLSKGEITTLIGDIVPDTAEKITILGFDMTRNMVGNAIIKLEEATYPNGDLIPVTTEWSHFKEIFIYYREIRLGEAAGVTLRLSEDVLSNYPSSWICGTYDGGSEGDMTRMNALNVNQCSNGGSYGSASQVLEMYGYLKQE